VAPHKAAIAKTTRRPAAITRKTDVIAGKSAWMLGAHVARRLLRTGPMSLLPRGLAITLVLLAGCDLYFDHNTGDDDCQYGPGYAPDWQARNPQTGDCESIGGGDCGGCGPCAELTIAQPDWGACFSPCEALDEASCLTTDACRAAYTEAVPDGQPAFRGCWAVAPSGPVHGTCENLDAQECSRHDDCAAYYTENLGAGSAQFSRCAAEGFVSCFGDLECGPGAHCSTSDGECLPPPGCTGGADACPAVCAGRCVLDNDSCSIVDCGTGAHCEQQCHPCDSPDPTTTCDPICQPLCVPDQACDATTCPPNTECVQQCDGITPGNPGCGQCTISCVPIGASCEALSTEAACAGRSDCTRVYQGMDCTCYPNGPCECQTLTYERCEAL